MAFGVAVGILVADMLVFLIGTGTWQIGVVTALAMGAALLLGGGPLLVSQAATSAVLVTTIQVPEDGISLARFLDALVGGAVALAVATLVLPVDPAHVVRRAVEPVLDRLALALDTVAEALERRDEETAVTAIAIAREIVADGAARGAGGRARRHPAHAPAAPQPRARGPLRGDRGRARAGGEQRARGRARGRVARWRWETRPRSGSRWRSGCSPRRRGRSSTRTPTRRAGRAGRAAEEANAVLSETGNMSALHIVGQVRSTAVDLMRAAGVEHSEAVSEVRSSAGA